MGCEEANTRRGFFRRERNSETREAGLQNPPPPLVSWTWLYTGIHRGPCDTAKPRKPSRRHTTRSPFLSTQKRQPVMACDSPAIKRSSFCASLLRMLLLSFAAPQERARVATGPFIGPHVSLFLPGALFFSFFAGANLNQSSLAKQGAGCVQAVQPASDDKRQAHQDASPCSFRFRSR